MGLTPTLVMQLHLGRVYDIVNFSVLTGTGIGSIMGVKQQAFTLHDTLVTSLRTWSYLYVLNLFKKNFSANNEILGTSPGTKNDAKFLGVQQRSWLTAAQEATPAR